MYLNICIPRALSAKRNKNTHPEGNTASQVWPYLPSLPVYNHMPVAQLLPELAVLRKVKHRLLGQNFESSRSRLDLKIYVSIQFLDNTGTAVSGTLCKNH